MIDWFIRFLGPYTGVTDLRVGSRLSTKHGMGTITGGNIIVKLDQSIRGQHPNDKQWVFNLDKFREKEKDT